jgi:hypothetical protein
MSKSGFEIVYKGPEVEAGSMDVKSLAPSLLSLGELFEAANAALNGSAASVQVKVHAGFKPGSFVVNLDVVQSLFEKTQQMFSGHSVRTAEDLQAFIFGDQILKGLLWLLKALAGKPPSGTSVANQNIIIVTGAGNHIEVKPETVALSQDRNVRKAVYDVVQPIRRGSVKRIEIRKDNRTLETLDENDVKYLSPASDADASQNVLTDETQTAALKILAIQWEDKRKWMWRFTNGTAKFRALMADEAFRAKIYRGEPFHLGDVLIVDLRVVTRLTADGNLDTDYTIERVIDHRRIPEQLSLPSAEDEEDA